MNSRLIVSTIAAATLCAAALPASAQGRVYDRNASNNPEIYRQTHPEDAANAGNLQGPAPSRVERTEQHRREADRRDGARQEQARRDEQQRREADHRRHQPDRRHWDHRAPDRRHYGYVAPRPYYYSAPSLFYSTPPVYYSAPPVYYGAAPQSYYPGYSSAPPVFQAGDFLPPEYRAAQYIVTDWQWRGLSAPPYGYQWVLLGPDHFALVAHATGQIVSLVAAR